MFVTVNKVSSNDNSIMCKWQFAKATLISKLWYFIRQSCFMKELHIVGYMYDVALNRLSVMIQSQFLVSVAEN